VFKQTRFPGAHSRSSSTLRRVSSRCLRRFAIRVITSAFSGTSTGSRLDVQGVSASGCSRRCLRRSDECSFRRCGGSPSGCSPRWLLAARRFSFRCSGLLDARMLALGVQGQLDVAPAPACNVWWAACCIKTGCVLGLELAWSLPGVALPLHCWSLFPPGRAGGSAVLGIRPGVRRQGRGLGSKVLAPAVRPRPALARAACRGVGRWSRRACC